MNAPLTTRLLDVYRIGPGPSSSHTVGPMRAAKAFRDEVVARGLRPARLTVDLEGSLSATGAGHGTDRAVLAGLLGWEPATCDVDALAVLPETLEAAPEVSVGDVVLRLTAEDVTFVPYASDHRPLPHPNTLVCRALGAQGEVVLEQTWCSLGGGFIRDAGGRRGDVPWEPSVPPRYPFHDGTSLVALAEREGLGFGDMVLANERAWASRPGEIEAGLDAVWTALRACIDRGLAAEGELPGGLKLRRRAGALLGRVRDGDVDPGYADIARAQAYALAINEENAAGGRVVTAPTNGAAGILPAVLLVTATRHRLDRAAVYRALATAGAIAMIIRAHASLSGAEVGCQGEIGSATSMAAAALCEMLGGTPAQVEYAAEIGMEHNLGLTCDPLNGLVQAPCIERNAMGVAKAWSAAQLARHARGTPIISLDRVVRVMKRTGEDMRREYKETSEGGLAVSWPEC